MTVPPRALSEKLPGTLSLKTIRPPVRASNMDIRNSWLTLENFGEIEGKAVSLVRMTELVKGKNSYKTAV